MKTFVTAQAGTMHVGARGSEPTDADVARLQARFSELNARAAEIPNLVAKAVAKGLEPIINEAIRARASAADRPRPGSVVSKFKLPGEGQ